MKSITFGVKDINGNPLKLVVCEETKQYERGKLCLNSTYVDVWVKKSDLETIEKHLISVGFTRTDNEFNKAQSEWEAFKEWCIANNKKPSDANNLSEYRKTLEK